MPVNSELFRRVLQDGLTRTGGERKGPLLPPSLNVRPTPWAPPPVDSGPLTQLAYRMAGLQGGPPVGWGGPDMQIPTPPTGPGIASLPEVLRDPRDILRHLGGRRIGGGGMSTGFGGMPSFGYGGGIGATGLPFLPR